METHSDVSLESSRASVANAMGLSREARIKKSLQERHNHLKSLYSKRSAARASEMDLKVRVTFYTGIADSVCVPPLKLDVENVKAVDLLREVRLRTNRDALSDEKNAEYISLESFLYEIKKQQNILDALEADIKRVVDEQKSLMEELQSLEKATTPHERMLKRAAPDHVDDRADDRGEPPAKRSVRAAADDRADDRDEPPAKPPAKRSVFATALEIGRYVVPAVALFNAGLAITRPSAAIASFASEALNYSCCALACQATAEVINLR